jgi:hypothetical protein
MTTHAFEHPDGSGTVVRVDESSIEGLEEAGFKPLGEVAAGEPTPVTTESTSGTESTPAAESAPTTEEPAKTDFSSMKKAELVDEARSRGVVGAESMTKDELITELEGS